MKTLGIFGGVSPVSTGLYYSEINQAVNKALGGDNSAEMVILSVNFEELVQLVNKDLWDEAGAYLAKKAEILNKANVDVAILACNTLHRCAPAIIDALDCPFIHIGEATGKVIANDKRECPLLIGTLPTMTYKFISDKLGSNVLVPEVSQQKELDRIVFQELCRNKFEESSREWMINLIQEYAEKGADCVILGCTEFGVLLNSENSPLPSYNTADIHVKAATDFILN